MNMIMLAACVLFFYLLHMSESVSRLVLGIFFALNILFMIIGRQVVRAKPEWFSYSKKLLIAENEETMDRLERALVNSGSSAAVEKKILLKSAGDFDICDFIHIPFEEVMFCLPSFTNEELIDIIAAFSDMGVPCVKVLESSFGNLYCRTQMLGHYPAIRYDLHSYSGGKLAIKRLIDIAGGLAGMLLLAMMFPFVAIAIKRDSPGPIFFAQTRIGRNGRVFRIYKFRTMVVDAESRLKDLMKKNEMNGLMFKMEDDPRITKVGRFLRKTSLDEFPQFWNVLKGDMSLVGTRPPTVNEFSQYNEYYRRRLSMMPGLTGLWQVSGRNKIEDFDEVVKLDLSYIDNWSLWTDISIILKTVLVVLKRDGR